MVSPAPNLLTSDDKALLTAYIVYRFNLLELANYTKHPLLFLKDWARQPHIQAEISQYRRLEALQHKTETADARSAGINELMHLLGSSEDPIERRRAAQALIRVGTPQSTRKPKADPKPSQDVSARPDLDPSQDLSLDPDLDPDFDEDFDDDLDEASANPSASSVSSAPLDPSAGGTGVPPLQEHELRPPASAGSHPKPPGPLLPTELVLAHSDTS